MDVDRLVDPLKQAIENAKARVVRPAVAVLGIGVGNVLAQEVDSELRDTGFSRAGLAKEEHGFTGLAVHDRFEGVDFLIVILHILRSDSGHRMWALVSTLFSGDLH